MSHENGGWMNADQRDAMRADAYFPIMAEKGGPRLGFVPMALMRRAQQRALRNHDQTVEQLRERGGLSAQEAMAVLQDVRYDERRWKDEAGAWANLLLIVSAEFPDFNYKGG